MLRWGEMNNNKNVLPSFPSGVIDFGRLLLQIDPNTHLCLSERDWIWTVWVQPHYWLLGWTSPGKTRSYFSFDKNKWIQQSERLTHSCNLHESRCDSWFWNVKISEDWRGVNSFLDVKNCIFASFLWDFGIHYEDSVCLGRLLLWQVGLLPQSECKLAEIRSIFVFVSLLWVSIMSFLSCDKKKETTNFSSSCAQQGFRWCNCVYSELNIGRSQELISLHPVIN